MQNTLPQSRERETGFTMVEAVVYVGLLLLIVTGVTLFLLSIFRADVAARAEQRAVANAVFALQAIERETRHADEIYDATSMFGVDDSQISLRTPRESPADHIVGYTDIYLDNGVLYLRRDDGTPLLALTAGDVQVTVFRVEQYLNGNAEGIRMTLTVVPQGFASTLAAPRTVETFISARVLTPQ